jgi:protein-L-isoaspartate(D-aspartate) O-methyltransferase
MAQATLKLQGRSAERERMVALQVARRGVSDQRVLQALREVPREAFVGPGMAEFAYEDTPLPIAAGQTISQPYMVALMAEAAGIKPGDRVLDVGTGSGYAAAVLGQLAAKVYSIERHRELAASARQALETLHYTNIEVREGDGTLGWPDAAPFDAILVAAGGPEVPEALRRQLKIGGRLIIPIGERGDAQELVKVVRDGTDRFHEEELGRVTFVPLIGQAGWPSVALDPAPAFEKLWPERPAVAACSTSPIELIRKAAEPLAELDEPAFGEMFDRFRKARVVLLGEATHGTSEFYRARAQITRRLVESHGFNIVAVEADWPDAARVDRYVRHKAVHVASSPAFRRFPQWMWRNVEVANFVDWLRAHNAALHPAQHVGFFGLDIYNMYASISSVVEYLDGVDPAAAKIARERYGCLTPWQRDPATYGRAALTTGYAKCERPVLLALRDLLNRQLQYQANDPDSFLDAAQNARLVAAAERYYRAMYYATAESWNLRDQHMFDTVNHLMDWQGADAKIVIWAHNSHIGNAAATDMGWSREEINIGQLCREKFGNEAVLIGFGTDHGTVAAADDWGGPMKIKKVQPSHPHSYEYLCREACTPRFLIDLRKGRNEELRSVLMRARLERAIGVIYRPETELASHYFEAHLPEQFDSYVWFEKTKAVTPLPAKAQEGMGETYPFGL